MRVVRAPDGTVDIDPTGRRPGRGAYLCADGSCWSLALRRESLEKALSADLSTELRDRLAAGALELTQGGISGT